jgi:hypothetical protein
MRTLLSLALAAMAASAPCSATAQSRPRVPGEVMKTCDKALKTVENERPAHQQTIAAIEHLLGLVHPTSTYSYSRLVAGHRVIAFGDGRQGVIPGCKQGLSSEVPDRVGTPLPSDYPASIRRALAALAGDSSTPIPVRNTATCME